MNDYRKDYYEQSCFWDKDYLNNPVDAERINITIRMIPSDIRTVLDVGCGNGAFVNTIANVFPDKFERIVGLDSSIQALKHVKTEKINKSIIRIPFETDSFDLVSSLEVLEHLTEQEFHEGINEIQRVSRKYILISVPNDENIAHSLVLCPKCCCAFHPYFHMRSFKKEILNNLFTGFKLITIVEMGPEKYFYLYNDWLIFLRLGYKKPSPSPNAICPQCGYQNKSTSLIGGKEQVYNTTKYKKLFKFFLAKRIKKKSWLLALYEKNND
jgi:SAM-dependent methyltransferase